MGHGGVKPFRVTKSRGPDAECKKGTIWCIKRLGARKSKGGVHISHFMPGIESMSYRARDMIGSACMLPHGDWMLNFSGFTKPA